ncbi:hypothetical protein U1Q18_001042, partial [Sarracenia purpurea var. burkii]
NPPSCIAVLVLFLVCVAFVGCGFSPLLLTISFLILSSLFFTFSKQKPVLEKPSMGGEEEEALISDQEEEPSVQVEEKVERDRSKPENGPVAQQNGAGEDEVGRAVSGYKFRSPDSFSESESVDQSASTTDQDSEADWLHSGTVNRSPECSDVDSISDEESLIEIALPSGHYVAGPDHDQKEELVLDSNRKIPDFLPRRSLMEVFADVNEMNEEDNLIEIDISMGSIKCSNLEIKT